MALTLQYILKQFNCSKMYCYCWLQ